MDELPSPTDWSATITMDINALRMFYDHIVYSIEVWPGSPRRHSEEQEFLMKLKMDTFAMLMEYNITQESN